MTDPVLTLVVLVFFVAAASAVHYFKSLDAYVWQRWRTPALCGLALGVLLRSFNVPHPIALGVLLTLMAVYVRHTGDETEPIDGMLLGGVMGAGAALPFAFGSQGEMLITSSALLAGSVAGYGITVASSHVADTARQLFIDVITAALAVAAAYVPGLLFSRGVSDRETLIGVAATLPLIVVAAVFQQWPDVRAELRHEASLGFLDDGDVRATAHPILRLGRGGWTDRRAHRKFVRLANRIALRKRQQRGRPDDRARLYQLEIIKLRMLIQEMSRIDHAVLSANREREVSSDTMKNKRHEA
jgi:hypothetical protein